MGIFLIIALAINTKWIPENNREPDEIASYIKSHKDSSVAVLICPPFYDLTFLYHYNSEAFKNYQYKDQQLSLMDIFPIYSADDFKNQTAYQRIFLVDANSEFIYSGTPVKSVLSERFMLINSREFKGGEALYEYQIH